MKDAREDSGESREGGADGEFQKIEARVAYGGDAGLLEGEVDGGADEQAEDEAGFHGDSGTDEPDVFGARSGSGGMIHGAIHDLAHAIEPAGGAGEATLATGQGRAETLTWETEF